MTFDVQQARTWANKEAAMGTTRTLLLGACDAIDQTENSWVLQVAQLEARVEQLERERDKAVATMREIQRRYVRTGRA